MKSSVGNRPNSIPSKMSSLQQLLLTLFPVILFTVVEEWGGLKWALILSIFYAFFEMGWEYSRFRRVSGMTFFSNAIVVGLSLVSYSTEDGFWFKMQPAILEIVMGVFLIGSYWMNRPMLAMMLKQQRAVVNPQMESLMRGITLRLGFFFFIQAGIAVYAALYWSTEVWAFLKSIGIFIMMLLYLGCELVVFRRSQFRRS